MKSIHGFLLATFVAIIALVAGVEAVWSYRQGFHEVEEIFDAELAQYARTLATEVHTVADGTTRVVAAGHVAMGFTAGQPGHPYERKVFYQFFQSPRTLLVRTSNAPAEGVVPFVPGFYYREIDGRRWRLFVLHDTAHGRWVITAERGDVRAELAGHFASRDLISAVFVIVVLSLAAAMVLRAGLAPLRRLADDIGERHADELTPLALARLPRELKPLVNSLNALMLRLDASLERERRFAGDAAHELRTPAAVIQTYLENALAESGEAQRRSLVQSLDAVRALSHLIEQLLALARSTPEVTREQSVEFDLAAVVREVVADMLPTALAKRQEVSLAGVEKVDIAARPAAIRMLVRNLLENAIRYTPVDGRIELNIDTGDDGVTLSVCDDGPGIPVELRERVFDRFYRLPRDRSRSGKAESGSGLGMAIVSDIAGAHSASVTLSDGIDGRGLGVTVRFPSEPG